MQDWTPKDIKNLRKKYKMTQAELGRLLGVAGNYIYMLEKGVREPSNTLRLLLECVEANLKRKGVGK